MELLYGEQFPLSKKELFCYCFGKLHFAHEFRGYFIKSLSFLKYISRSLHRNLIVSNDFKIIYTLLSFKVSMCYYIYNYGKILDTIIPFNHFVRKYK